MLEGSVISVSVLSNDHSRFKSDLRIRIDLAGRQTAKCG